MRIQQANSLMPVTPRPDAVMVEGQGSWIWDDTGKRYLDFIQGWAVNCLGHAPAQIQRALAEQSARLLTASPALHNQPQLELAGELTRASGFDQVFFCNCGTEANEGAIKLARKWGRLHKQGAYEIITTHDAFHGRTLAAMAASGKPDWDEMFPPMMPGFIRVPFGDANAVEDAISPNTVAVMVEPIQGEAGVVVPPDGYLAALRRIAHQNNLLLIADEIQTGMGRTGTAFAHQAEQIEVDIMTLGKGLGGGVPIAALLASKDASCFDYGEQGGTYNGNPLMAAVALAVCRVVLRPDFLENVRLNGDYMKKGMQRLAESHGCPEVRGRGLLMALRLPANFGERVAENCFDHGLLVNCPRPNLLRFMPALTVTRDEIDEMIAILGAVLQDV